MTPRILHVVESYGAGVAQAVNSFVAGTPEFEHHLMYRVRTGEYIPAGERERFASAREVIAGPLGAARALRAIVRNVRPDVVHAHSSYSGALVRVLLRRGAIPIVYSPHCFAFERLDLPAAIRGVVRLCERALAQNTSVFAVCSAREIALAGAIGGHRPALLVPNAPVVRPSAPAAESADPELATVGRAGAQKDPQFFGAVVDQVRRTVPGLRSVWIGDGDQRARTGLVDAGVSVTGWLSRDAVHERLASARLMVHTARWEGSPMVIHEAHALGVPVVVRDIPAFADAPAEVRAASVGALAALAAEVLLDPQRRAANLEAWERHLAKSTLEDQSEALRRVYEVARG